MGGVPPWGGGRVGHGPLRTILSARPPRASARRHRIWCRPVLRRSARPAREHPVGSSCVTHRLGATAGSSAAVTH